MRVSLPMLSTPSGAPLRRLVHPGQPLVIAFGSGLELHEAPALQRIRAELRGLGAALLLVSDDGAFCFRPDDALELDGARQTLPAAILEELREACGLSPSAPTDAELTVAVLSDGEILVGRHTVVAADRLFALAEALSAAGRDVLKADHPFALSRREVVLASLVGAFALLAAQGCRARSPEPQSAPPAAAAAPARTRKITLDINGQPHALEIEPRVSLLDALRERLGLTGSKKGCDMGQCGACTVLIGGRRVKSCLTLAVMVGDAPITTIEGLAQGDALHPMQAAFVTQDALQCGYCTPGQIMSAIGLVRENRAHTDDEVREQMSGNICRCGAYSNIVQAIQSARGLIAAG